MDDRPIHKETCVFNNLLVKCESRVFPKQSTVDSLRGSDRTPIRDLLSHLRLNVACESHLRALFQLVFSYETTKDQNGVMHEKCFVASCNPAIRANPVAFPFPFVVSEAFKLKGENITGDAVQILGRKDGRVKALNANTNFDNIIFQTTDMEIRRRYNDYFKQNALLQELIGKSESKKEDLDEIVSRIIKLHGPMNQSQTRMFDTGEEYDAKFVQMIRNFISDSAFNVGLPLKYKENVNSVILAQIDRDRSNVFPIPFASLPVFYQHMFSLFEFNTLQSELDLTPALQANYNLQALQQIPGSKNNVVLDSLANYQVSLSTNKVDQVTFADDQTDENRTTTETCLLDNLSRTGNLMLRTNINCADEEPENQAIPLVIAPANIILNLCTLNAEYFNYSNDRPLNVATIMGNLDQGYERPTPLIVQGIRFTKPNVSTFLEQWTAKGVMESIESSKIDVGTYGNYQYLARNNILKSQSIYTNEVAKKIILRNNGSIFLNR